MTTSTKTTKAKPMTKAQFILDLAALTELPKAKAAEVLDAIVAIALGDLGADGPGVVVVPGLVKLKAVAKPATAEHQKLSPFTGEQITVKAKPASVRVTASPVPALKRELVTT